ncbi:UNVERIFIED_CONTAM: hypothetical protein Sangu_3171500 [Sesamum angustifolium]|uniref:Reverse transcriptase domain-containing protein n=1 Tax=Sesamum angustifolium TaxID=2727405 RepID=A0AAW2JTF1_9LAMI
MFGLNGLDHQRAVEQLVRNHKLSFIGLIETRVSQANVQRTRRNLLTNWSWFEDYSGPAGRIWLAWNSLEVGVEILEVGIQFIHCRAFNKRMHTRCLISVLYGDYDIIPRRELWSALRNLSTENVQKAQIFLDKAQSLFTTYKEDISQSVKCCRRVFSGCKAGNQYAPTEGQVAMAEIRDQSSKVFFQKINSTRVKQRVFQITTASGELLTTQHAVTQEFISYFQNLLGGSTTHRLLDLGFLRPALKHTITTAEASLLVAPVTESEVKEAFFDIDVESAQVRMVLPRHSIGWHGPIVGRSMFESVGEYAYLCSDYRPISVAVLYKAITKIIVKRLQRVLPLLITYSQNAFVPGRSISDNILLAQELLAGYNQTRLPERCTLKVDIQKAYDRSSGISWWRF